MAGGGGAVDEGGDVKFTEQKLAILTIFRYAGLGH